MNQPKTVAEFRAMMDARRPYTKAINDAFLAGDWAACGNAQRVMREAFPRSAEENADRSAA